MLMRIMCKQRKQSLPLSARLCPPIFGCSAIYRGVREHITRVLGRQKRLQRDDDRAAARASTL